MQRIIGPGLQITIHFIMSIAQVFQQSVHLASIPCDQRTFVFEHLQSSVHATELVRFRHITHELPIWKHGQLSSRLIILLSRGIGIVQVHLLLRSVDGYPDSLCIAASQMGAFCGLE